MASSKLKKITPDDLRDALRTGVINFAFKKLDTDLRFAIGTTNLSRIPVDKHPKTDRPANTKAIAYYDLEEKGWRSCSVDSDIFK